MTYYRVQFLFAEELHERAIHALRSHIQRIGYDQQSIAFGARSLPDEAKKAMGVANVCFPGMNHLAGMIETVVEAPPELGAADAITMVRHAVCSVMVPNVVVACDAREIGDDV